MPSQATVTQFDTLDLFSTKTTFSNEANVYLYVYDTDEIANADKPGKISLSDLETLIGGGGGGEVDTVNGIAPVTGNVTIDADDLAEGATNLFLTAAERAIVADVTAEIDSDLTHDRWQHGSLNKYGTIYALPSGTVYAPSADTDDARGTVLATALAAFAASADRELVGSAAHICQVTSALTVTLTGKKRLRNLRVKCKSTATALNYLAKITADTAAEIEIHDCEFDHNGSAFTKTGGTGDTLYLSGAGSIDCYNMIVRDGPSDGTAVGGALLRLDGSGAKRLHTGCRLIDPDYSCIRQHSYTAEYNDVALEILNYKTGSKARFFYCDSQAVGTDGIDLDSIVFKGGRWVARGVFARNANFDPWNGNIALVYNRVRWVSIRDMIWDFGEEEHDNTGGDSFLKFDDVDDWEVVNVTEYHTTPGTVATSSDANESVITVGKCNTGKIINCRFDGYIKGAGDLPTPHKDTAVTDKNQFFCYHLLIENTTCGQNTEIDHYVANACWFDHLEIVNCDVKNCVGNGSGGGRCVINNVNGNSTEATRRSGQRITIRGANCRIHTSWADNKGAIVRTIENVGLFSCDDLRVTDDGNETIMSFTNVARLMATARPATPTRLELGRIPIRGKGIASVGADTTYAHTQKLPVTPTIETQDCFPSLTTSGIIDVDENPDAAEIINIDRGAGGNGYAERWVMNSSGVFVEERTTGV